MGEAQALNPAIAVARVHEEAPARTAVASEAPGGDSRWDMKSAGDARWHEAGVYWSSLGVATDRGSNVQSGTTLRLLGTRDPLHDAGAKAHEKVIS